MAKRELAKIYDPHQVERKWYDFWHSRGYFRLPDRKARPDAPAFCITIPPPNVTGSLHIGHALQHSIHDAIARWRRLCGDRVLVVPGTDHAAISTNMKVEQKLAEDGISRRDIGRDAFLERCWEWTRTYGGQIIEQLKALGCSYDWDRTRFTLDEKYYRAVYRAFVEFSSRGWLYHGRRVVNWCPHCSSTVSDLEVEHKDHAGHLWYIRYPLINSDGYVTVATTRPETMLGDTAVAVNSQDPRYQCLHGEQIMLPLMNRSIPVICDDILVDPEFGTGVVKVTPAHDLNDFEAGQRNGLPSVVVVGNDAKMTAEAGPYAGMDRYEARKQVIADLKAQGLLEKIQEYTYSMGHHDRCHTVLEPLLSDQWFLRMKEMAKKALEVIGNENLLVEYIPDRFRNYTINWLEHLRDWNISRQIWWGHRIPWYYCRNCGAEWGLNRLLEPPVTCEDCGGSLEQDQDTLDTWFSSALWPFVVLGWPDQAEFGISREQDIYPTSLMITARDILYLWIVRMIMTSLDFTSEIPFRQVLVHPTVLNIEGRRMSKSLGTGVDPLDLISQYGSDATRFSLLSQCASDQDIRFGEARTEMARNFCNKIWNASRFVLSNLPEDFSPAKEIADPVIREGGLAERWILSRYAAMLTAVAQALEQYEMADAAQAIYGFFWSEFCDWFVEMSKPTLREEGEQSNRARQVLWYVLEGTLRALHPFMPFITEEIWQQLPGVGEALMVASWPQPDPSWRNEAAEREMEALMQIVTAARKLRADYKVPPSQHVSITVASTSDQTRRLLEADRQAVLLLVRGSEFKVHTDIVTRPPKSELIHCDGEPAIVSIAVEVSREELQAQEDRLLRELSRFRKEADRLSGKLIKSEFLSRAPQEVVAKTCAGLQQLEERIQALQAKIDGLKKDVEK